MKKNYRIGLLIFLSVFTVTFQAYAGGAPERTSNDQALLVAVLKIQDNVKWEGGDCFTKYIFHTWNTTTGKKGTVTITPSGNGAPVYRYFSYSNISGGTGDQFIIQSVEGVDKDSGKQLYTKKLNYIFDLRASYFTFLPCRIEVELNDSMGKLTQTTAFVPLSPKEKEIYKDDLMKNENMRTWNWDSTTLRDEASRVSILKFITAKKAEPKPEEESQPSMQPPSDAVVELLFRGNLRDSSGSGNHVTENTGAVPATDRFGQGENAYRFDGKDDYLVAGTKGLPVRNEPFSLSVWYNFDWVPKGNTFYTDRMDLWSYGKFATQKYNAVDVYADKITFVGMGNDGEVIPVSHVVGRWYHYAVTYDGSTLCQYMDGEKRTEQKMKQFYTEIDFPLNIGRDGGRKCSYFGGRIDDFRIYSRALTPGEITGLYRENGWE